MSNKGLTSHQLKTIKNNLRAFYNDATEDEKQSGRSWYSKAHQWCVKQSINYGFTTEQVAGALSALSPRNKWERNKFDTEAIMHALRNNENIDEVKVCTFTSNKDKAVQILRGERVIEESSPKTYSFVRNIAELDSNRVTVDVWHIRACFNKMREIPNLTDYRYKQIERATLKVAEEFGEKGYEFQAIIWEQIRNSK